MTIAPVRPAEEVDLQASSQLLIEEARQHRRRRLAVWSVVVVVIAGVLVGVSVGHNSAGGGLTSVPLRHGVPNPAFTGPFSQTQSKMLAFVLPTSGADVTTGAKFMNRLNGLVTEDRAACMDRAGYKSIVTYKSGSFAIGDNTQFPPIAALSANGFVLRAADEPYYGVKYVGKSLTGSEVASHVAARNQCEKSSSAPLNAFFAARQPLSQAWQERVIPQINRTSAFKKALAGWSYCVSQGGVTANSIDAYFQNIGPIMRGATNAAVAKDYLKYGKLYATCLGPAEALRDHLRVVERKVFERQHWSQIAALTNALHELVG